MRNQTTVAASTWAHQKGEGKDRWALGDKGTVLGSPAFQEWHTSHGPPNGGTLDSSASAAIATTTAIIVKPELLKTAETLIQILQDYVRFKLNEQRQELAAAARAN